MTAPSVLDSRYSWFRLAITLAVGAVGNVGMWSVVVVIPAVQAEFGIARSEAALAYSLTMFGFALGNLLIGRAVDRFGVTAALLAAAATLSAGFVLAAVSPSAPVMIALQFVIGLGTAVSFAPLIADVSHWFLRRRGIAVAIAASGNYMAGAIWPLVLSGILASFGWRTTYVVIAVIVVAFIVPLSLLLRRRVPEAAYAQAEGARRERASAVGFSPRTLMWLLALAGVGCCVAMSMPQVHIVSLSVDLGYGATAGAQILSVMLLGGVISRIAFGFVADRLGGVRTLLIGSTLQCLALFLYLPADALPYLFAVSLVFGLSQGGIVPAYAIIVREYLPAREAGTRIGFVIMATIIGMALGGWLSGVIHDATGSYELAFVNGILWNLMNIAVMLLVLTRTRAGGGGGVAARQPA